MGEAAAESASGKRRDRLATWLTGNLPARFEGRILDIDRRIAEAWGIVMARGQRAGQHVGVFDAFFAATAEVHRLTLVTRNVGDFLKLGVPLLNPWQPEIEQLGFHCMGDWRCCCLAERTPALGRCARRLGLVVRIDTGPLIALSRAEALDVIGCLPLPVPLPCRGSRGAESRPATGLPLDRSALAPHCCA
ncbi:MAG TPA: PIN domain-containing protein [Thermoanaerobaculia bacterium]|nr:PIN domain-containing protein [Thermoanaerobaculia bacterium]